jgi:cyclopropane fatty-acyl-phospholipid synthase-like methyltransferase
LLDPLIDEYLNHPNCSYENKQLSGFENRVKTMPLPIEAFETNQIYDLVVVINVLEHCFSAPKFFKRIKSITAKDGFLIFHDKLIPNQKIGQFTENIYDSGHPLRVADEVMTDFLHGNYITLFENRVDIPSPIGDFDSIYFIGRKIGEN